MKTGMTTYQAKASIVLLCAIIAPTSCSPTIHERLTSIEQTLSRNNIRLYYDGNLKDCHEVEIGVVGFVDDELEAAKALNSLAGIKTITTFSATSGSTPSAQFFEALETMEAVHDLRIGPIDNDDTIRLLVRFPNPTFVELIDVNADVSWEHLPVWKRCEVFWVGGWIDDEFLEKLQYFSSLERVYLNLSENVTVKGIHLLGKLPTLTKLDIAEIGPEISADVIELLPNVLSDRVELLWEPKIPREPR